MEWKGISFQNTLPFFRKQKGSSLFFLKNVFSALCKIYAHIDKHSCNLTFPIETLHLPCGNEPHQTQKENQILYQFFLWPLISRLRCGKIIHSLTHLSVLVCRDFSLKSDHIFIGFRWAVPQTGCPTDIHVVNRSGQKCFISCKWELYF